MKNFIDFLISFFTPAIQPESHIVLPANVNKPPTLVTVTPPDVNKPTITNWAKAVQQEEGWSVGSVSYLHNNPGNLGYSSLTASWGAIQGSAKTDGGHFCFFRDYNTGFTALCNFLTLGAEDELVRFHQARTLGAFSSVYGNTGAGYGDGIAKTLGVPVDILVSTFL